MANEAQSEVERVQDDGGKVMANFPQRAAANAEHMLSWRHGPTLAVLLVAMFIVGVVTPRVVSAGGVPVDRQALILIRALAYDRNLTSRAGDELTVAVAYKFGDATSKAAADKVSSAFKATKKLKVQGLSIRVVKAAIGRDDLEAITKKNGVDAIFLCPNLEGELPKITALSQRVGVTTLGASREYAERGVSIVVVAKKKKASLVVNLPSAKAEGMNLSSELLELADVIK